MTLIVASIATGVVFAKDAYQPCTIVSMSDVACGSHRTVGWNKSADVLCQEYVIRTATLEYHIRQPKDKHASLLPIGAQAEFLVHKDEIKLRVNGKVRTFTVTGASALGGEKP